MHGVSDRARSPSWARPARSAPRRSTSPGEPRPAAHHRAGGRWRRRRPAGRAGADPAACDTVAVARATAAQDLQLAFYAAAQKRGWTEGEYRCPRSSPARGRPRSWPPGRATSSSTASAGPSASAHARRAAAPGAPWRWPTRSRWSPAGPGHRGRGAGTARAGRLRALRAGPVPARRRRAARCARLVLTASGGPFRGRSADELADVTAEQALAHPTWAMGPVVTINSATLVNKGLELIEAHLLFDVPYADIDVVVHPQSIVHSMVTFTDGATIAQASPPDMRLPIALALAWPDRLPGRAAGLDWSTAQHVGVRPARRRGVPGRAPGPQAGGRWRRPGDVQRRQRGGGRGVPGGSPGVPRHRRHSSRVLSTTRRISAHPPASRTCWPRRSGPGSTPGASSPEAEAERDPPTSSGSSPSPSACSFSIGFHEFGHFIWARRFGMRVPQFMVGFGPTAVLPAPRGDRVRHQGHPARRLHPHRRHDPAGRGGREQARHPHAQLHRRGARPVAQRRPAQRRRPGRSTRSPGGSGSS